MQTIRAVIATLGCLGLLAVIALYSGVSWLSSNQDQIIAKVDKTVGIGSMVGKQCDQMEARYQSEWDKAVNNHSIAMREAELEQMRREIDRLCRAK